MLKIHSKLSCRPIKSFENVYRSKQRQSSESRISYRYFGTHDGRSRLSNFWVPTGGIESGHGSDFGSVKDLVRAGFIRQAGSGVFHFLPLGLRVQQKIESLIDKHMGKLGASKLSLSSITSEELWQRSGRFTGKDPEMYRLKGPENKPTGQLLAPTHEEEITNIAKSAVRSYKDLPLRLYQISRKYRNELRPRQGLLRAREFLMKDLYTFDSDQNSAMQTYNDVVAAYHSFFQDLDLTYLVAEASSGDMGGNLSHEFHVMSPAGEDNVVLCKSCGFVANEEILSERVSDKAIDCSRCHDGNVETHTAIELGHTFHLGTRYSEPLDVKVEVPKKAKEDATDSNMDSKLEFIQMGCHGIGISRIIGAMASLLKDEKGLNWPVKIAPFEAVLISKQEGDAAVMSLYDTIRNNTVPNHDFDVVWDDRQTSLGWKMNDADLIGCPVLIIAGKSWEKEQMCEIQCRRLGYQEKVPAADIPTKIAALLDELSRLKVRRE